MIKLYLLLLFTTAVLTTPTYLVASPAITQSTCLSTSFANTYDATAAVRKVHDGDTLQLNNGRKVRLIGINTPELARGYKAAEPFAIAAKKALTDLFSKNKTIKLRYGDESKDHYGRYLAHGFLANGQNIQVTLLDRGLASAIVIPPNTNFSDCYLKHEKKARCNKAGLWKHTKILDAKKLKQQHTGFHLIQGNVKSIRTNNKGIWLNIDNMLTVGIRHENIHLFDADSIYKMRHHSITVRGWINKSNRQTPYYLRIRHPASIQLSETFACN
ncbi:MAG: thermonuclease family protein [Gammaproteobacteria bacterium]|nr:thermonuclease family protein [Gammaproteobacteria bacterium]